MELVAIVLISFSALLHASWNFLSKKAVPSASFFLLTNIAGAILLLPYALYNRTLFTLFPFFVWKLLLLTGFFQALYYSSLAIAYKSGQLSVVYPLARSLPIVLVVMVGFLLGQGAAIGVNLFLGGFLVVVGCLLLPLQTPKDFSFSRYRNWSCIFALLAAAGTAGYSLVDAEALRQLREQLPTTNMLLLLTLLYAYVEVLTTIFWLVLYLVCREDERALFPAVVRNQWRLALAASCMMFITYPLVLISMSWVKNVGYVVGFRQLSIPIGVAMGWLFLGESLPRPKLFGVILLLVGLVVIALP